LEIALYDDAFAGRARDNIAAMRDEFTWESVLEPLIRFCRDPRAASDRSGLTAHPAPEFRLAAAAPKSSVRGDLALFREYVAAGGVREVITRATGRIKRVARAKLGR
jgi:hypothetical protein